MHISASFDKIQIFFQCFRVARENYNLGRAFVFREIVELRAENLKINLIQ